MGLFQGSPGPLDALCCPGGVLRGTWDPTFHHVKNIEQTQGQMLFGLCLSSSLPQDRKSVV